MRPIPELTESEIARFWGKVDKNGPVPEHMPHLGRCWVWTRPKWKSGYGMFIMGGDAYRAHRIAWSLENGPISEGMLIIHHCDRANCCRPDHLAQGTPKENTHDMIRKGRARPATGDRSGSRTCIEKKARGDLHPNRINPTPMVRGSKHFFAKLTEEQVHEIRILGGGKNSAGGIALRFGVSRWCVRNILQRKAWAHVQ